MYLLVILFQWIFYKIFWEPISIFVSLDFSSIIIAYSYLCQFICMWIVHYEYELCTFIFMCIYFKYYNLCAVLLSHFYFLYILLIKTNFPQFQFTYFVFIILLFFLAFTGPRTHLFIFPNLFVNILFISFVYLYLQIDENICLSVYLSIFHHFSYE